MDLLRYKLLVNKECRIKRFDYNPQGDLTKPLITGLLPSESIFDIGTPNKNRHENTTIIASNSTSKTSIILRFKWRPNSDFNLITCISELTFTTGDLSYHYEHIETYTPVESRVRPGRLLQYGSRGSQLKFFIFRPYNRMRILFSGQMVASDGQSNFVKLNIVLTCTGNIIDFKHQIDADCFRQMYEANKPSRSLDAALSDLGLIDRHEQLVKLSGDFIINNDTKSKQQLSNWGFYIRQFNEDKTSAMTTKRIYGHLNNGQVFHIGNNQLDRDQIGYGFTCFHSSPDTIPIDKPAVIDWDSIDDKTKELEFQVNGQTKSFKCKAVRRNDSSPFFDLEMNGKQGWVLIDSNDNIDTLNDIESIKQSFDEYQDGLKSGRIVQQVSHDDAQTKPLIVGLDEEVASSSELVGSKASSLAQLSKYSRVTKTSFCVPGGIVLTRFAHALIIDNNEQLIGEIKKLEDQVGDGNLENLREACEALQKLVEMTTLPEQLKLELTASLTTRYGDKLNSIAFAVRSSSWGEDEDDMSAAGQLSTLLNVKGIDTIFGAVLSCFASKFTYANVEYKRQHGLPLTLPMAVVIQEMVLCDKAGVMFTCDPTTGDDSELLITANFGLGESVVSGQSEPDSIMLKMLDGKQIIKQMSVGTKSVIIDGENPRDYDRSKCCLNNEEIFKLGECGVAVAKYYRCQRDIEWGYKEEQLYLFQSRPITGLEGFTETELIHECDVTSRAELEYVSRANVGEVMPYAITPMTLTYCVSSWATLGFRLYNKFISQGSFHPGSMSDLIYDSYHMFFSLRCSRLFPSVPGEKPLIFRAMEVAMFGHEIGNQPELMEASAGLDQPENPFQGFRFDLYVADLRLIPFHTVLKEKYKIQALKEKMTALKLATGYDENKLIGLYNQMAEIKEYNERGWFNHILMILLSNESNAALTELLSRYIKDPVKLFTAVAKILGNTRNVLSAEIPERIKKMSQMIEAKGKAEAVKFTQMSTQEAIDYLENGDDGDLSKQFGSFLEKFGHRGYNEFELSGERWGENKGVIVDMLKKNCSGNSEFESAGGEKRKWLTIDEVVESLGLKLNFIDECRLKKIIAPRCQTRVATREITKDILVEYVDRERMACRMLAKELRKNLRIPDEDLFFYMTYDELLPIIQAPQPSIVAQAIRRRNMFKIFKEPWKFDEIFCTRDLIPNHLKPSKELDADVANAPKLYGTPASSGRVQAKVCLIDGYKELDRMRAGDILLTHSTDIAFSPIFPLCSGVITEVGGLISHGAVVAREYGLPSVLGIPNVTRILEDGEEIILDADEGAIIRLDKSPLK